MGNSSFSSESAQKKLSTIQDRGEYQEAIDYARESLEKVKKKEGQDSLAAAKFYYSIGMNYACLTKYREASLYLKKCEQTLEKIKYKGHEWAILYVNMGFVQENQGDLEQGMNMYIKAKDIIIQEKKENDPEYGLPSVYNNIGMIYRKKGEYDDAIHYISKAIDIVKAYSPTKKEEQMRQSLDLGSFYNNLALNYSEQGKRDQALHCYDDAEKLLGQYEDQASESLPLKTKVLSNKATINFELGEYMRAQTQFQQTLACSIKIYGSDSVEVATDCNNLGLIFLKLAKYKNALNSFQKSQAIIEKKLGKSHDENVWVLNNLAIVHQQLGQFKYATEYCNTSQTILNTNHKGEHPLYGQLHIIQGQIAFKTKDYEGALSQYQNALQNQCKYHDINHHSVAAIYNNIGNVYLEQNQYTEALQSFNKALEIFLKCYQEGHPDISKTYVNIGEAHLKMKKLDEARICFQQAEQNLIKKFNEEHPELISCYNNWGQLEADEENQECMNYFSKALDIGLKHFNEQHPDVAESYEKTGKYLIKQKNIDEGLANLQKAMKIYENVFDKDHVEAKRLQSLICEIKENSK